MLRAVSPCCHAPVNQRGGVGPKGSKSLLFLKKKKQKDFSPLARVPVAQRGCKRVKVFWFFFSKKNRLLPQ
jgi:hypothetical protein